MDTQPKATDAVESSNSVPQILETLPPDALLPVRWVRELFAAWHDRHLGTAALPPMLTTEQFKANYSPERSTEWVRDMCNAGRFPGAERRGRQWLIPVECLVSGPTPLALPSATTGVDEPARAQILCGPRGPRGQSGRKIERY